ncbi:MAG: AMP-binding protein [Sphingomonadales bacterium]|nr:AMP-binding protein [Sphingomonadales bacterium]
MWSASDRARRWQWRRRLYQPFRSEERSAPREIGADDIAWMPYTSGTTGRPKGVMHSHRSLLSLMRNILVELPAAHTSDVLLHIAPLTHLSGYAMLAYFLRGASHIASSKFDPENTLALIEQHKVTVLPLVPTMLNLLLPHLEEQKHDVSSVHTIMYGGSPIAPDRLARSLRCLGPVFVQSYGLTEYPWASWMTKKDHGFDIEKAVPSRLASAGRVSPFVELRLVNSEGAEVSDGETGEIQLRGDGAMSDTRNRPQETSETILPGGWIATATSAAWEDGFIHIGIVRKI